MLKLSKRTDYGLIALSHLATHSRQGSASAKEIAARYQIPMQLLSKVLQTLTRGGLLCSEHGTNGGYRLARDPNEISALEVIRAIDGPVILTECFTNHGDCDQSESCTVREPLRKVHEGILNLLAQITIKGLAGDGTEASGADCEWDEPDGRLYTVASVKALMKR